MPSAVIVVNRRMLFSVVMLLSSTYVGMTMLVGMIFPMRSPFDSMIRKSAGSPNIVTIVSSIQCIVLI